MNDRDTHFLEFAHLLIEDLRNLPNFDGSVYQEGVDTLIAQRAYDLVNYVLNNTATSTLEHANLRVLSDDDWNDIPDLTRWPDLPDSE